LAILLAALGALLLSRSLLQPLGAFIAALRSGASADTPIVKFDARDASLEVRSLSESFEELMHALERERGALERRGTELAAANAVLTEEIREREKVERALRESEAQLRQSQKLEAVGTLAGGIAHDFNNLLTIIQSCATFLSRDLPDSSGLQADVVEIHKATRRASELTQQLLAFSRKQVMELRDLDVNRHVINFVTMLRRVIGHGITIETALAPDTWPVYADPGQIERVLMNLGVNARDAMPDGGTMYVRTENVAIRHDNTSGLAAGDYVMLTVEDTGTGIDPDVLPRIFEPFVTTKPPGVGTGLGLATVHGIVEQTGGAIHVTSTPGRGTRFTVFLPRAIDDPQRDAAVA
jgi:two-component system, cell cycle sensor histidine kinase and response regulator CckA